MSHLERRLRKLEGERPDGLPWHLQLMYWKDWQLVALAESEDPKRDFRVTEDMLRMFDTLNGLESDVDTGV